MPLVPHLFRDPALSRPLADRRQLVAVWIADASSVEIRVERPQAWRAFIRGTTCECRGVEGIDDRGLSGEPSWSRCRVAERIRF